MPLRFNCVAMLLAWGATLPAAEPVSLPAAWETQWNAPPASCRPLLIEHGLTARRGTAAVIREYQELGLGGIVTNVPFANYLQDETNWKILAGTVEACAAAGLRVWLYDEHGYPSGSAGGLTLKKDPAGEAEVLAFDPSRSDPFFVRRAYEHTHASNNYAAARRYINLLDRDATAAFLSVTHEAYAAHLAAYFGKTIEATFTDEPSLMAVNMGQLPEKVRSKVPVTDPPDPSAKPLATVPWSRDLPEEYRRRYHRDLGPLRRSLFEGDADADRRVRREFWSLIGELTAERYFGQIQSWCRQHHLQSSGHKLAEESLLHHIALDGNGLSVLRRMDIPGLDMLSSDPQVVLGMGWMTAAMPFSAALHEGHRQVMTEISDFSQRMSNKGSASLEEMNAAAAWQAAWGVTEFTLYYRPEHRTPEDFRAYCRCVGHLNAILRPARPAPQVLLYYPIDTLWEEYRPVAEPLRITAQTPRAQRLVQSFNRLGQILVRAQVPFALADYEALGQCKVERGWLTIGSTSYSALIVPREARLPSGCAGKLDTFAGGGGRVVLDKGPANLEVQSLREKLSLPESLEPARDSVVMGRFVRDGRRVLVLLNVGMKPYAGMLRHSSPGGGMYLDPASGRIDAGSLSAPGKSSLRLAPRQALLWVEEG